MAGNGTLQLEKVTPTVGAELRDVDLDRLVNDEDLPDAVMTALEQHGVLASRGLSVDDESQLAFCRKLSEPVTFAGMEEAGKSR